MPKVETALPSLREPVLFALKLLKQLLQVTAPGGENADIPMQGAYIFILVQRRGDPHRYGLLPDPGEPLADPALAQQFQHALLYDPRFEDQFVEMDQLLVA